MIRVLIVDDHTIVRQGLRFLLQQQDDIEVVGEAGDGEAAIEAVREQVPTVVLLDLLMPRTDGLTALREIKRLSPATQVVILTSHQGDSSLFDAIKAGAVSYVLKTAGVDMLVQSVRAAALGESVLDPNVAARVLEEVRKPGSRETVELLSRREIEVLTELARGRSNKEIARELSIGEETVKTHVSNILSKLHLADRTQAAIYGLQRGLIPLNDALEAP
ncbi:MAG TPA: response regulator transcription factor [Candidatus Dormibacteraeota bacterium]|nr:response regulator transcription factor [Candidatus Dormibacteraeota bacterium]